MTSNISSNQRMPVVLQTGFRIFFLGAASYAVFSVFVWMLFYIFEWNIFVAMPVNVWHGHEMIYGFTMAVVAGFLLTAVMNWTGHDTLRGYPLLALFLLWVLGRVFAFLPGDASLKLMSFFDFSFLAYLLLAVIRPVVAISQWKQFAVFSKIILVLLMSILFYFSFVSSSLKALHMELLFSVYMIVSLILTISRRVVPFFVEKGVGYPVTLRNSRVLDLSSMVLLVVFSVCDVLVNDWIVLPAITSALVVIHIVRLIGWFTKGILKKPLLWVLFTGYLFIILGFILKTVSYLTNLSPDYALHAFTYGGIGIMCLGMMARVAWGHTGRSIQSPPRILSFIFGLLAFGACARVIFPIIDQTHFALWVSISQILWMMAFSLFLLRYTSVLISSRPDGKFG